MKSFFLFFALLAINFSANASITHNCIPTKTNSEISKVVVSYTDSNYILSIFHTSNLVEEVIVKDYSDVTYVEFYSDEPPYNLFIDQDTTGTPNGDAFLDYGLKFQQRLYFDCQINH